MSRPDPLADIAAEQALVGAAIRDAAVIERVNIEPDDFYRPAHGTMWALLAGLNGAQPDRARGLLDALRKAGELKRIGGGPYIHTCVAACVTPAAAEQYARVVKATATQRRILVALDRARQRTLGAELDDVDGAGWEGMADLEGALGDRTSLRARGTFRRWSAADLAAQPDTFTWTVAGLLAHPTYGPLAGAMKTLKTTLGLFIVIGLAAGAPILGQFAVPEPRPVVCYVGEGGRVPFQRRLRRVAAAMGVDLARLPMPLEVSFDVAPLDSPRFRRSLERDLAEIRPGLVWLDPYYAYHGTGASPANLHEEGALLTDLSSRCLDGGASLLVANHYNQTGTGAGLKRITMAGTGEWADSWILLSHREPPDVEHGRFRLDMSVGSRQWGGREWALDLDLGRFDHDAGHHDGDITWTVAPAATARGGHEADLYGMALELLEEHPWQYTRAGLAGELGGNSRIARGIVDALLQDHQIKAETHPRAEGTRSVRRQLLALPDEPGPDGGATLDQVGAE